MKTMTLKRIWWITECASTSLVTTHHLLSLLMAWTARNAEFSFGHDVRSFVERNFYVDDGLVSLPSVERAVSLMRRTQQTLLQEGGLRLHRTVSNDSNVMTNFPSEDLANCKGSYQRCASNPAKFRDELGFEIRFIYIQINTRRKAIYASWITFNFKQLLRPFRTCSSNTYPRQAIVEKDECSNNW